MWERPAERKLFAGVASGISTGLGVRKIWVRLAFIVLALGAGVGFVLYGIGWLVMPREGDGASVADRLVDRANEPKEWVSIGLVVLGILLLAGNLDLISSDVILAGGLIAIGVVLYMSNASDKDDPDGSVSGGSPPTNDVPEDSSQDRDLEQEVTNDAPADPGASLVTAVTGEETRSTPPRRSRRPRSRLPRLTFGVLLLVLGGLGFYDGSGGSVRDVEYVAAALGIVGAGVLVSSVWGRARWLLPLGFLLMPVVLLASVTQVTVFGRWGDFLVEIDSFDEVVDVYRYGGGEARFVFDENAWSSSEVDGFVEVALGLGSVSLFFPSDVNIIVTARIGLGALETGTHAPLGSGIHAPIGALDHSGSRTIAVKGASSEFIFNDARQYAQSGNPGPTLFINVNVGLGAVTVAQMEQAQ